MPSARGMDGEKPKAAAHELLSGGPSRPVEQPGGRGYRRDVQSGKNAAASAAILLAETGPTADIEAK